MNKQKQEELHGGNTIEEAAKIFMKILNGNGTKAQNDAVIANSAMAIHCVKPKLSLLDCVAQARESIESKKALHVYNTLIKNQ
jgi:anthranilate phosphoribosyltransferase